MKTAGRFSETFWLLLRGIKKEPTSLKTVHLQLLYNICIIRIGRMA